MMIKDEESGFKLRFTRKFQNTKFKILSRVYIRISRSKNLNFDFWKIT